MGNKVTLEYAEQLVARLRPADRLKLASCIREQLSNKARTPHRTSKTKRSRLAQVDAWLAECDAVAESIKGKFDSAEDIRQIREERTRPL